MHNSTAQLTIWKKIDRFLQHFGCPDEPKFDRPENGIQKKMVKHIPNIIQRYWPTLSSFHAQLEVLLSNADSVSYQGFRFHVDSIKQPQIQMTKGFTLIFDKQKCLRAIIRAASIDTRKQCQVARYFVIARANPSVPKRSMLSIDLFTALAIKAVLRQVALPLTDVVRRLKKNPPTPVASRQSPIVWTTLRLTSS